MFPRETGNNAYAKFWRDKQRVLHMVFLILANFEVKTMKLLVDLPVLLLLGFWAFLCGNLIS